MEFSLRKPVDNLNTKRCALEIKKLFPVKGENGGIPFQYQLYKVILETGRKHQIRSIFSFFRTPIVGDKKYGSKKDLKDKILLFAYQLEFNNLSSPLTYLNKKIFAIDGLESWLIKRLKSKKINSKHFFNQAKDWS